MAKVFVLPTLLLYLQIMQVSHFHNLVDSITDFLSVTK